MATANAKTASAPARIPDVSAEIMESGVLQLSFLSGKTVTIDPAKLSDEIRKQATLHGLKQKLVDAAAIARDTSTGKSANAADKEAAVMEVFDRITSEDGTWNKVREAGAGAGSGLLVAALMRLTGKDKPAIVAYLSEKSNEEKAALRKNQKVAELILQIQAEQAKESKIDTDALLGELMGEPEADANAEAEAEAEAESGSSHAEA